MPNDEDSVPQPIVAPPHPIDGCTSSEDDVEVPGSRKKRLLTENFDRIRITGDLAREREREALDRAESVGTMKSKEEVSVSFEISPSTKKRKGVGRVQGASNKPLRSLAELSKRFGDIQLNKDFYDSIKQTESRCEPGEDLRDVDRQAFRDALIEVEQLIKVQHELTRRESGARWEYEPREADAISLIALSLDVIQFLIDNGAVTSSTATTGLTLEHSLSKSTSQNVNTSEVIESPWKAKKHPRRSASFQEEDVEGKGGTVRGPSRQPSLISNEPPKRQRKYEMEEVSSKPFSKHGALSDQDAVDGNDARARRDENIPEKQACGENSSGQTEGTKPRVESAVKSDGRTDDQNPARSRSQSQTYESSKRGSAAGATGIVDNMATYGTIVTGNDACNERGQKRQDEHRNSKNDNNEGKELKECSGVQENNENASGGDGQEKPVWKSSLVCADLSLNEVGSRIYGPLITSLRAARLLGETDRGGDGGQYQQAEDVEVFESLVRTYAATTEESQELGNTILSAVEDIYRETYGLRNTNISQKALAIVVEAFNHVMKESLMVGGDKSVGEKDALDGVDRSDARNEQNVDEEEHER